MRTFRTRELAPPREGIKDVGVVVVSELGHKTLACRRTTLLVQRDDKPANDEVEFTTLRCEACDRPIAVSSTTRAIAEISKGGILRYRVLTERDGKEVPGGPWRYVPVGAWR